MTPSNGVSAVLAIVLSLSLFSGRAFSEGSETSGFEFENLPANHPTLARFELLTGAHQTMPGITISHPMYYSAPKFIGFGVTVSQFDGPLITAVFAELRHLPIASTLSETFAFSFGYWAESSSFGSDSDNGFMFGVSLGFTRRVFGAGNSRLTGEIGFRIFDRQGRDFDVLAPCRIGLPCISIVGPRARNTSNLVFSLGLLF